MKPNRSYLLIAGIAFVCLGAAKQAAGQAFTDISTNLPAVSYSSLAWGDYDNDGDLDLAVAGDTGSGYIARIYRNDGNGTFTDIGAGLTGVAYCSLAWGDYDNDGDLDLAVAGQLADQTTASKIYRNNGDGTFTDIGAGLSGVMYCSLAWGDYDNDGDLDLAVAGGTDVNADTYVSKIYRNNGDGTFTDINAGLTGVVACSLAWGDYDNDGDLDLALAGFTGTTSVSLIYRNNGNGSFTDISADLTGVDLCSLAWGDYDNDGDLDLALAGFTGTTKVSNIYRNNGNGSFTDISADLTGVAACSLAWGDYDNDGKLDLALAGFTGAATVTFVYRNDGNGVFTDIAAGLAGAAYGSLAWGDYDNDGKLDLALVGNSGGGLGLVSHLYRNNGSVANTPPSAPAELAADVSVNGVTFSWHTAIDAQTPAAGLSYNLRVGTSPGDDNIFCGMADLTSGLRRLPATGDAQKRPSWTLKGLGLGTYYWSVQAVDTAFAGSAWAAEKTLDTHFIDINAGLTGVAYCSLAWGDYDNDGDLDGALAGMAADGTLITRIYRNDGNGVFTDINAGLTGVYYGSLAWGDYDNDGKLDLALAGVVSLDPDVFVSKIYHNNGDGTFTDVNAGLTGVAACSLAWGDYDNDGKLDLALAGVVDQSTIVSKIYRNNGNGTFTDIAAGLTGVAYCSLAWGDYDNDGDLDLALAGMVDQSTYISKIYRNNGDGTFTDINAGLSGVAACSLAWGDYDNDGDLDLALAGLVDQSTSVSRIYRNNGDGTFTDINAGLTGVFFCSLAWGDCDNDGDLDLALTGNTGSVPVSKIYRNNGNGVFADANAGLAGVMYSSLAWGDYDNDGRLDLALAGLPGTVGNWTVAKIYRNVGGIPNTPPAAPSGLATTIVGDDVTFGWNAATDAQTPAAGLSYNLRVGTSAGDDDVFCGMADLVSGWRRLPATGNAQKRLSWTLNGLGAGPFHWSVQAVDTALAGSPWAAEVIGPNQNPPGQTFTFYLDADGDGFGDVNNAVHAAAAPPGYVINNIDCDDNNAAVNPWATEICNDGIDNDCDELLDCDDFYCKTDPACVCGDCGVLGAWFAPLTLSALLTVRLTRRKGRPGTNR